MKISKTIAKALTISAIATPALFAATAFQNQVGYLTNGLKQMAVIDAAGKDVVFKDSEGNVALTITAPEAETWIPAGDTAASLVDFSEIKTAGTYQAYVGDEKIGHPIVIADDALEGVTKGALKFFYFQRASTELPEEFAGKYARAAGHPDTAVKYHASTGHTDLDATISSPKGWYDAGDYGKYVVNSGISTYTLLQLYQHNKDYFNDLKLNIPESNNEIPDILDEIKWNLDWMLTMQDTDGGVFHKLTTKQFASNVMPEKATSQRYVIGKAQEATWNFAAVMALASEIYQPYDEEFAKKCIVAAEAAYRWAVANSTTYFVQPSDVGTGSYTSAVEWTTRMWMLAEMYRISGEQHLLDSLKKWPITRKKAALQSWQHNYMLCMFSIATNPDIFEKDIADTAKSIILDMADGYISSLDTNGYGVPLVKEDFMWGSNGIASNKGMLLIHAYILTKDEKYLSAAIGIMDYILGRNPLDLSYLTGFGVNPIMNPHHRPSRADTVVAPVPGMIAGGPNYKSTDCSKSYNNPNAAAKSYYDNSCSYATNEVAINWNAPFAYLVGSIQAIAATGKSYDVTTKPETHYQIASIPFAKGNLRKASFQESQRLVVRGQAIQVELKDRSGNKRYFNLKGKQIH